MTKKRRRSARVLRPSWRRVQALVRCAEGHDIWAPQWALFWPWRDGLARFVLCESHAVDKGYVREDRPFVLRRTADEDVKARQTGGDE